MSAIDNARTFVSTILSRYDTLCHPGTAKIRDIFNPGTEEGLKDKGLKESSLEYYSERFDNPPLIEDSDPPQKMTHPQLNEEVITLYKTTATNLSTLFVLAGILDPPSQDPNRKKIQSHIIELLVQDHLASKKDYVLDPKVSVVSDISSWLLRWAGKPEPRPQFADGRRHFYGQIFLEVYSRSSDRHKGKIVALLKDFQPQLDSGTFQFQRVVFKIERVFNSIITNRNVKFGLSIALGIGSYFAINKVIALSGVFFNSPTFAQISSGAVSYTPALIVQISNGFSRIVGHETCTRLYGYFKQGVSLVVPKLMMNYVFKFVLRVQDICYQGAFGPSARVQVAIAESLSGKDPQEAEELLDGGMKAYQIWMHLVEQGPQKGLFEDAVI